MGKRIRLWTVERQWVEAVFDTIFPPPPEGVLPHGVGALGPADFFENFLAALPTLQAFGLRLTVWAVAWAPCALWFRPKTITTLPRALRERLCSELFSHRSHVVRQLSLSLKAVATLLYSLSPAVRARMLGEVALDEWARGHLTLALRRLAPETGRTWDERPAES